MTNKDFSQADRIDLLRIIDANGNRAAEGLRVVEDFARFGLDDQHLSGLCKQLRHELITLLNQVPCELRLRARDTLCDVGVSTREVTEQHRDGAWHVAAASASRVQQALRCLEEYSKPMDDTLAGQFEAMRYRMYVLQRALGITVSNIDRLQDIQLYVLVDGGSSDQDLRCHVTELIESGVRLFQLRDKQMEDRELLQRARVIREILDASNRERADPAFLIMNDRPDLALLASADGVHVGQDELSVKDVRAIVGPEQLVGVSTHSLAQACQAVLDGADYLGCGPTFPTATKDFTEYPGIDFLAQVSREISLPSFAIGGITRQQLPAVLATGMSRVAVAGAIARSDRPAQEASLFLELLSQKDHSHVGRE